MQIIFHGVIEQAVTNSMSLSVFFFWGGGEGEVIIVFNKVTPANSLDQSPSWGHHLGVIRAHQKEAMMSWMFNYM